MSINVHNPQSHEPSVTAAVDRSGALCVGMSYVSHLPASGGTTGTPLRIVNRFQTDEEAPGL